MKKIITIACIPVALLITVNCLATVNGDSVYLFSYFKGNGDGLHLAYSRDGYKWKALLNDSIVTRPGVGKDRLMRDPCIIRGGDGKFHMVWTVSWKDRGIGYASSADLLHWSEQKFIPVMMHEDSARNSWAPELTYDEENKQYMIYWASTIPARFPQKDTSAEGSINNHRLYFTITKDFENFSRAALLYDPGFSTIDATIVKDKDRYIMFFKNETRAPAEKNLRIAYGKQLTGPYSEAGVSITGNYWAEGPTVLKIREKWIVYFDKYRDHKYGAIESTDLIQWRDVSDTVEFPPGIRHGTVFVVSQEEFEKLNRTAE